MSDDACDCADPAIDQTPERTTNGGGWIAERSVTIARLPDAVAEDMGRFFGEPIETFEDVTSAIRDAVEGDGITVEDLCQVEEETPHVARTGEETYHFRCFYDGIVLAHLVDEPVEIRTETPTNDPIEIEASPERGSAGTPSDAVMSFGVATDRVVPADDGPGPTPQDVYDALCPYVKAFHTRDDYERWAADVAATTVGFPLESGVQIPLP